MVILSLEDGSKVYAVNSSTATFLLYILISQLYLFRGMTKSDRADHLYSKVGPKGQVVISKRLRDKYSIKPGKQVEQIETKEGVLIKSVPLLEDWTRLSHRIGKKWPRNISSVQSIREDREK
jgi:AbrB family looped-hinge helix DNA binding protein